MYFTVDSELCGPERLPRIPLSLEEIHEYDIQKKKIEDENIKRSNSEVQQFLQQHQQNQHHRQHTTNNHHSHHSHHNQSQPPQQNQQGQRHHSQSNGFGPNGDPRMRSKVIKSSPNQLPTTESKTNNSQSSRKSV